MNPAKPPPAAVDDWSSWEPVLTQFSQATHCTTTLYTMDGEPAIGPICSSDTGIVLGHSRFFQPEGEGRRFEQSLAAEAALRLELVHATYLEQLALAAVPVVMFGRCHGAIVFGWLPHTFATALGTERLARAAGTDGRRLWTVLRLQPPLGQHRMALYARFLSSLVAAHTRLRETLAEVSAVTRLREESLARVAHELRTPLSSIMLRLSALLNTGLDQPKEVRTALEAIIRNVREESRLVDDIVDSARSQIGQLSISPSTCDLFEVVSAAVETIAPQASSKGVSLALQWSADGAQMVEGDRGRLQQAFWNLMANAVKFTNAGGAVTVEHRCRDARMTSPSATRASASRARCLRRSSTPSCVRAPTTTAGSAWGCRSPATSSNCTVDASWSTAKGSTGAAPSLSCFRSVRPSERQAQQKCHPGAGRRPLGRRETAKKKPAGSRASKTTGGSLGDKSL